MPFAPSPSASTGTRSRNVASPDERPIERQGSWSQSSSIVDNPHLGSPRSALREIEAILQGLTDNLIRGYDTICIPYRSRTASQQPLGQLNFPGRSVNEATKFTRMVRIMELSRQALLAGRVITKRNIYYQAPDLFRDQATVDRLVDDLACTLGVGRSGLNIVASPKGLIAGPLRVLATDGTVLSFASDQDKCDLVPPVRNIQRIDLSVARWVLVIEKEATFRTLAASQYWRNSSHGQGIIVTGKGYADLTTLEFLHLVHTLRPLLPMLCVVDCDPHGIEILRTYMYGSKTLDHEVNTRIPGIHWLGVKMEDIFSRESRSGRNGISWRHQSAVDSLITLTATDRKTAVRVLQSIDDQVDEDSHDDLEQARELQVMLMLNVKAEIQAIDDMGDLSSWLNEKMQPV
ncbi:Spo11/DNA topoisomerase VI subunit A [Coniella lustricola]|uniref:DNA topoisomerase (ATP-hydrolyzing) n=1 Tax=Coniella lustricola TaxID=2025994 RepID=A0A2T2ZZG7_9PEZI|nr:Spo11/DNA topoisomerase VI subunit A [Coniella lustricola]